MIQLCRRLKHLVDMSARFSDLKVGIRELSFPFMLELTDKRPLRVYLRPFNED